MNVFWFWFRNVFWMMKHLFLDQPSEDRWVTTWGFLRNATTFTSKSPCWDLIWHAWSDSQKTYIYLFIFIFCSYHTRSIFSRHSNSNWIKKLLRSPYSVLYQGPNESKFLHVQSNSLKACLQVLLRNIGMWRLVASWDCVATQEDTLIW